MSLKYQDFCMYVSNDVRYENSNWETYCLPRYFSKETNRVFTIHDFAQESYPWRLANECGRSVSGISVTEAALGLQRCKFGARIQTCLRASWKPTLNSTI